MARFRTQTRTIHNRAGSHNIIGLFWSVLLQDHMAFESMGEYLLFLYLEWILPKSYTEQPRVFLLRYQGKDMRYTPDVEVTYEDGIVYMQVKPKDLAEKPEFKRRMEAIQAQLLALGYDHEVFSQENQPRVFWENLRLMYGYVRRHFDNSQLEQILDVLRQRANWTLLQAVQALRAQGLPLGGLYTAMFYRKVLFNVRETLNARTELQFSA